jgi:hypothetical protein
MMYVFASLITLFLFACNVSLTYAQTITPTPSSKTTATPTPTTAPKVTDDPKNINILNQLKDKIASKVAQLHLVQRKGAIGTITSVSGTQITIEDIHGGESILDVDELTKFSSPSAKSAFGISDLTKGSIIDVLGLYNKQSKHILARFIDVVTLPRYLDGMTASVDPDNFVLTVISENGTLTPVEIENVTKTFTYTKEEGLQKSGFSKIERGKHIVVTGYSNIQNKRTIIATRIIVFPQLPANPRIIIPQQAIDPDTETVPSTGSGTKLTPLTR